MNFLRVWAIVLRQLYLMRSNYSRVFSIFIWITVDVVLWGFITRYLGSIDKSGLDFVHSLLGAIIFWDFFSRIMFGIVMNFFEDVWARNFVNLFGSPILLREYIAGLILSSIITSSFAFMVMLLIAGFFFGLSFFAYGVMAFPFLLVLFLFGVCLGIISVSIVLRLGPSSEWIIWPLPLVLSPFVGVFYPLSILPSWMQFVSKFLPPSYVFEELRKVVFLKPPSLFNLFISFILAGFYSFLSFLFFKSVYRYSLKTGLLSRYTSENIT